MRVEPQAREFTGRRCPEQMTDSCFIRQAKDKFACLIAAACQLTCRSHWFCEFLGHRTVTGPKQVSPMGGWIKASWTMSASYHVYLMCSVI